MLEVPPAQFKGDDWIEMRYICARWSVIIGSRFIGRAADLYLKAGKICGTETDPIARTLRKTDFFDLNKVAPAYNCLCGVWRHRTRNHEFIGVRPDADDIYEILEKWFLSETTLWFWDNPYLIRHVCRTAVQHHPGTSDEPGEALMRELRIIYPLPKG